MIIKHIWGEQPGVAIVIDGVPVQETSGKINVDLDNIESIKVIKGGASYLYGNDAIGGAVIITTKRPKAENFSKIETELGSFKSKKLVLSTNQAFDSSNLQLQYSNRSSDGYWDDAYTKVKSINGKYLYFIDDFSDLTFGVDYTKRNTGDGNSVSGTTMATTDPTSTSEKSYSGYYDTVLTKEFITYSNDFGDESNFMIRVHNYEDDKKYKTARFTKDKSEIWSQNGIKSEIRTTFTNFAFMAGIDLQRNDTDEKSTIIATSAIDAQYDTKEEINALYTELKHQTTQNLTTTLNFRFDDINHEYYDKLDSTNNVSPEYNAFSYRVGINYKIDENNNFFTSYSTGFRAPTVTQTSTNQVALAADPTLDIPAVMDIEKTYNYEMGLNGKSDIFSYGASIYQLDRKDYIGRIAGTYITSDDADESNYDNVGDMRSRGVELTLSSDKDKVLSFDLAYTYLDARFTSYMLSRQLTDDGDRFTNDETFQRVDLSGNRVPRTSKHNINFSVDYKATKKLTITPEIIIKSSYYADEINENKQKGYEIANLRASYKSSDSLEFFARIDNLFNTNYYQFVNISSAATATMEDDATIRVAPPRAFYAGLRYRF